MIPNGLMKTLLKRTMSMGFSGVATYLIANSLTNNNHKRKRHGKKRNNKENTLKLLQSQSPNTKIKKVKKVTKKTKAKISADEIKQWYDLMQMGAITQEEYDKKKKELL